MEIEQLNKSNFLQIVCPRCSSSQVSYGKASTMVKCRTCNKLLIKPRGGRAKVKAQVKEVFSEGR